MRYTISLVVGMCYLVANAILISACDNECFETQFTGTIGYNGAPGTCDAFKPNKTAYEDSIDYSENGDPTSDKVPNGTLKTTWYNNCNDATSQCNLYCTEEEDYGASDAGTFVFDEENCRFTSPIQAYKCQATTGS